MGRVGADEERQGDGGTEFTAPEPAPGRFRRGFLPVRPGQARGHAPRTPSSGGVEPSS
ncbi:hypothetical protein [Streptomyces sp. Tu 3180]|uniref:hypothetical protein n=1 Tax=Streptomyces sp. Tu 3180 TaxID=2682611 RepID=UPI00135B006E|nr:hypothetical protein [Streptomyces sp. Tu 3180]KAF3469053.1 hypothetical protein GL259_35435 [Streptomyces sp. Tu 3180]